MEKVPCMRRFIASLAAVLLVLLCGPVFAVQTPGRVVRIGYVPGYGVITDPTKDVEKGYGYEYFLKIGSYAGWTCEFVPCGWQEGLELLATGAIDFFGPLEKDQERAQRFLYPEHSMGVEYGGLFIRADDMRFTLDDPQRFDGMRVGTTANNFFNAQFAAYCAENGIEVTLVNSDFSDFADDLQNGRYDAALTGSIMALPDAALALKLSLEPYYFVTSYGNEALRDELDDAIAKIELDDVYYPAILYEKYYRRNPVNIPAFTAEEQDYIARTQTLPVVCDPNWSPIAYYDEAAGDYAGISVDVLEELGKGCGLSFTFAPVEDYDTCKRLLQAGEIPLILPHTEPAESLGVTYTESFFQVSTVLIGRGEIDLNQPLRVGVANLQSEPAQVFVQKYPQVEPVSYQNTKTLVEALQTGEISYIFANTYVYDDLVRSGEGGQLRSFPTDITYPLRIGVSDKADPLLLSILNKSILRLSDGRMDSIVFSNTVNRAYTVPFSRALRENMFTLVAGLAVLFALMIVFLALFNRRTQNMLRRLAYVDDLTGLSTLAKFQLDAGQILKTAPPSSYLLASMDVDNFKYINDVFGYDMGNRILNCMAEHFLKFPHAYRLIGRTNADNFVFLIDARDRESAVARFSDMLNVSEDLRALLPANYNFVLSVGLYQLTSPSEPFTSSCDKANIARKHVKGGRTSQLWEYTQEMDNQMQWKKELTLSMDDALESGAFKVYLQPKYRFADESLAGAEALVRWQHPEKGLLSPAYFIPYFERNGFIVKLDFYMFRQVCQLLRHWLDLDFQPPTISVNLSRLHLGNPHLVDELLAVAREYRVPLSLLQLELTESIVLDQPEALIDVMGRLRNAGFEISVDDFGSGYSSLNLLTDLPVDVLKLDKGFLDRISGTGNSRLIVEQVIDLAKKLHLSTVAEGVETKEQVDLLRRMGCDLAQGYYYSKPIPPDQFAALLNCGRVSAS